jgi:fucose permease
VAGGTTALVPLMTSLAAAGACFFFVGVSMGTLDCGANVMLLNEFAAKGIRVDPFMQALHAAFAVGAFISPLWMHFLTVTYNHAVALWSMAALFPIFALLVLLVLGAPTVRPPKPADDAGAADTADNVASRSLRRRSMATTTSRHSSASARRAPQARRRNWLLQLSLVGLAALFLALYVGAEVGSGGYIDVYAQQHIGLSADDAAYLNSGYWGSFMAGRILAVFVATRVSPFTMMASSLLMRLHGAAAADGARRESRRRCGRRSFCTGWRWRRAFRRRLRFATSMSRCRRGARRRWRRAPRSASL